MKLLSTLLTALMLVGFAGAASAECMWGNAKADDTAKSEPPYLPEKAGA
jgi:hypothetical protein